MVLIPGVGTGFGQGYGFNRAITISHLNVPNTDQSNFPVLISGTYSYLATSANGGNVQSANGYDIVFTSDAAGSVPLNFEMESYNPSTGAVVFWISIPTLSHTTDTLIYMWYGNSSITASQANPAGVWDANFQGVWHLSGNPPSAADSTSQGHNGTNSFATAATGQIGGAASFEGSGPPIITIGNMGTAFPKGTISMWVNAPTLTSSPNAFSTDFSSTSCGNAAIRVELTSSGNLTATTGNPSCSVGGPLFTSSLTVNTWHYLTLIWDSSDTENSESAYYDGILNQSVSNGFFPSSFNNVVIGAGFTQGSPRYWDGLVDEVRMSNSIRSADWIATEFANQSSPGTFYAISPANTVAIAVSPTAAVLYGGQTEQFAATITGSSNSAVTWAISPTGTGSISTAGLYTAPTTISAQQTVTVTVTSSADTTKTASSTITLNPPISVAVTPSATTLIPSQSLQFSATLANTSNSAVAWSVSPAGTGTVSAGGIYAAPSTIATQQTVTLTATSLVDSTKSASATITLSPASGVFSNHRPITISHSQTPNSALANFPLLISGVYSYLATAANGGQVQNSSGYDIIFTADADGSVKLDHEIETYNPATGAVNFWVRIPTLSPTADTVIYMHYGDSAVTASLANSTGVWNSNYVGVWHLANGSTLNPNDSTANQNNGTNNGATPTTGEIDGAAAFNGSSEFIGIPSLGVISNTTPITLSAWVNPSSTSGIQKIIASTGATVPISGEGNAFNFVANLNASSGKFVAEAGKATASTDDATAPTSFTTGQWAYLVGTYDANKVTLYVNGVQEATTPYSSADVLAVDNSNGWSIGEYIENGTAQQFWNGSIDEVRVSNTVLSLEWISAEYNNQSAPSTFYSIGTANAIGVNVTPGTAALYAGQTQQFDAFASNAINPGVTWSVSPSGTGSINSSGVYTAPSSISTQQTVTVTATSAQDNTMNASATVTLYPPAGVTVSPSTPAAGPGQTLQFGASVSNATTQAVAWSISPAVGSISTSGLYTAPATVSSAQTVTVTATSVAEPSQAGTVTLTLGPWAAVTTSQRAITISHTQVSNTDQTNFPVLVSGTYSYLATISNGGEVQNANGYDIVFTSDPAGTSRMDFEIDNYNPVTGAVSFWVRIPTLSHTTDTVIYMHYGNANVAGSLENKSGVWMNSYGAVWHFSNGAVQDSSGNGNNASIIDATATAGYVGGAFSFNGSSQYLRIPSSSTFKPTSAITLEAWVTTQEAGCNTIFGLDYRGDGTWNPPSDSWGLAENCGTTQPRTIVATTSNGTNNGQWQVGSVSMSSGQWYQLVGTYNGSTSQTYVNGAASGSARSATGAIEYGSPSVDLAFGVRSVYTPAEYWDGDIDEARISTVARSADWIATEYNNLSSPSTFYTAGVENPPLILSASPASAEPGTSVILQGSSFGSSAGTLTLNGSSVTVTSWSANSITMVVPSGANSGPLVVTTSSSVPGNSFSFTVLAPFISSLTPTQGPAGTSVTISGASFGTSAGTVTFGGVSATTSSWSDTSITASAPSGAGIGNVIVSNNGEQSNGVLFGAPFISGLLPSAGTQGTSVTINGASFGGSAGTVSFAGVSASITSWSSTSIVVVVPASALSGPVVVTAGGFTSNSVPFLVQESTFTGAVNYSYDILGRLVGVTAATGDAAQYNYDAVGNILSIVRLAAGQPAVLSFSPASGPVGTQVTISGSNFSSTPSSDAVTFNGTAATVSSATSTQIVVTVPSGASSGAISVTAPGGTATSGNSFMVTTSSTRPTITSFTPQIVAQGGTVTITGTNFDLNPSNNRLLVNTTPAAAPTSVTSTSMVLTAPVAGSGRISLSNPGGTAVVGDLYIPATEAANEVGLTQRTTLDSTTTVAIPSGALPFNLLLFDGVAGRSVTVTPSSSTYANCTYWIYSPANVFLGSANGASCGSSSSSINNQVLPVTGTYAVRIFPGSSSAGSMNITLTDTTNVFSALTPGNSVTLTTTASGQSAQSSFSAAGGQQATLQFSSNTFGSVTASVLNPDGTTLISTPTSATSFSFTGLSLPQAGIYTVLVTPSGSGTGSIQISLTIVGGAAPLPSRLTGTTINSSNPLSTDLAGLFLMNEGSGTTDANLVDSQVATFSGAALPTWTSDPAISFQGGSSLNSYLNAGADLTFDQLTPGQMTVVAKVFMQGGDGGIAEKNDGDFNSGFVFGVDDTGALRLTVEKSTQNMQAGTAAGAVLTNQWVQVAFTWDGTVGTSAAAQLYLNGVLQNNTLAVDGSGTIGYQNATNQPFRIGNATFDFPGSFSGNIAYLAVYKGRILSATELGQLDAQLPIH